MKETLITILRNRTTNTVEFRRAAHKIGYILASEAAAYLHPEAVTVETPLAKTSGRLYKNRVILVPVLRAGLALLSTFLHFFDDALVGMLGVERNEETAQGHGYFQKLPKLQTCDDVLLLDPMIATGGTGVLAIERLLERGASEERITYISVISAPEGLELVKKKYPKINVVTAQVDESLNAKRFILPGLGDFGDRYYGTLE